MEGNRLYLRQATQDDIDFIMRLEYDGENLKYIVPFPREKHLSIIAEPQNSMDIIVAEKDTHAAVGYLLVDGLTEFDGVTHNYMHVIIDKKGCGYGHEAMQLMKAWSFATKKAHRLWVDCKIYNARALHLYESEGLKREGIMRETICTDGVYEDLVVLAILDSEYRERLRRGLEISAEEQ